MSVNEFISNVTKTKEKASRVMEVDIEEHFVSHAKNKKCIAIKIGYLHKKGFPDRTVLVGEGQLFFIEFKRKGKKQSPQQRLCEKLLVRFGFTYKIFDEIGQAEKFLDDYLEDNFL